MDSQEQDLLISELKKLVWQRAFGATEIEDEDHYYREIAKNLSRHLSPEKLGRPGFHWHTVRNFYQNKTKSTILTREILATYAFGTEEKVSWRAFPKMLAAADAPKVVGYAETKDKESWRIKVMIEVPIIIEIEEAI